MTGLNTHSHLFYIFMQKIATSSKLATYTALIAKYQKDLAAPSLLLTNRHSPETYPLFHQVFFIGPKPKDHTPINFKINPSEVQFPRNLKFTVVDYHAYAIDFRLSLIT
jgi:hypothetical protein